MSKELVVVGLDGIIWRDNLLRAFCDVLQQEGVLDEEAALANKDERIVTLGSCALHEQTPAKIDHYTRSAANKCLYRINKRVVALLGSVSTNDRQLIAMSSAPSFLVATAVEKLNKSFGLNLDPEHSLASRLDLSGEAGDQAFLPLDKPEAVTELLVKTSRPNVAVGIINGLGDLEWAAPHCQKILAINPKQALQERVLASGPHVQSYFV